ncbi:inositol monophosphatase family protein, partial [Parafrankia sp. FMc6]|uniref:inositol monophosphatase family protein n=1 Tax=Parafrankia soli TaxID=2599596 RepID=UPI0034D70D5B
MDDHALAAALAEQAGSLLLDIRGRGGAEGDRQSNELLLRLLAQARPDDAVLSEESADDPIRLTRGRVWIIDPLDGTREYGEPPRDDWAVHVALAVNGTPTAGAVGLPAAAPLPPPRHPPAPGPPPPPTIHTPIPPHKKDSITQSYA